MNYFAGKKKEMLSFNPFSTKNLRLDEDIISETNLLNGKKFQKTTF